MKYLAFCLPILPIAALLVACATSASEPENDGTPVGTGTKPDAAAPAKDASVKPPTPPVPDSGTTATPDVGTKCVTTCTTDTECQNSCPVNPNGGANCCDTATGTCYGSADQACIAANNNDAGGMY
jgi:hypothetical protein